VNVIWFALLLIAFVAAAMTGRMEAITQASFDSAKASVSLAIGLVGAMALWLGLMRVAQDGGLSRQIARGLRPIMTRLFPEVPADHPAMSAMIMNFAANMLGLANAATPLGIKAMIELNKLNRQKGTATNAMALFLAINTSHVALLPTGVMAIRSSIGSTSPGAIIVTTWFATACSTIVAITVAKLFSRLPVFAVKAAPDDAKPADGEEEEAASPDVGEIVEEAFGEVEAPPSAPVLWGQSTRRRVLMIAVSAVLAFAVCYWLGTEAWSRVSAVLEGGAVAGSVVADDSLARRLVAVSIGQMSLLVIPGLMLAILVYGVGRGVKVYQSFIEGAKEGFDVALKIIPYLVAILVAVGMLRASGALDGFIALLRPLVEPLGMPAEILPMALIRPLSGSGAMGVMTETMQTYGPDSMIGKMVSTISGSTETTFYVIAVYFGAVGVTRIRHALPAGLVADFTGVVASVFICRLMF